MNSSAAADFETLVRTHAGLVARIAATYERRPALIEELVQEVFLAVYQALPVYRGEASIRTFIARIANNVCIDHVRRAARKLREVDVALAADIADHSSDQEEATDLALKRRRLVQAVRALDLPLRQVMGLHLEGFTNVEIAGALSLSPGNVGVRLHRARTMLEKMIADTPAETVAS
jgi:RNA polymerase sigma factor (sigma-70 family)